MITEAFERKMITAVGDARCDSPGHCAKYGFYTFMEASTGAIVGTPLKKEPRPLKIVQTYGLIERNVSVYYLAEKF